MGFRPLVQNEGTEPKKGGFRPLVVPKDPYPQEPMKSVIGFTPSEAEANLAAEAKRAIEPGNLLAMGANAAMGVTKGLTLGAINPKEGTIGVPFTNIKTNFGAPGAPSVAKGLEELGADPDYAEGAGAGLVGEVAGNIAPWGAAAKLVQGAGAAAGLSPVLSRVAGQGVGGAAVGGSHDAESPEDRLANAAIIGSLGAAGQGLIEAVRFLPGIVKNSDWFRRATIKERGLVVQSADEVLQGLKAQGKTEGEIIRIMRKMGDDGAFEKRLADDIGSVELSPDAPVAPAPAPAPVVKPAPIPKVKKGGFKPLVEVVPENPVTPEVIADQLGRTSSSIEGRQRAAILKEIGNQIAAGKSIDEVAAGLIQTGLDRGMPPQFEKLVKGIVGTLKDAANPESVSGRVGVGGGHGASANMMASPTGGGEGGDINLSAMQGNVPAGNQVPSMREAVAIPELMNIAREIRDGRFPELKDLILGNPNAMGVFFSGDDRLAKAKAGDLWAKKELLQDPEKFAKVLAHEIGHAVDWVLDRKPDLKSDNILAKLRGVRDMIEESITALDGSSIERRDVMMELARLTQKWNPFDPFADQEYTTYRMSPAELYAEALSVLFNNPAMLQQEAPQFYKLFHDFLDTRPQFKAVYDETIDAASDPLKLYEFRSERTQKSFSKGEEAYFKKQQEVDKLSILDRLKTELIDANTAAIQAVKAEIAAGNRPSPEANPIYALEEATYTFSEVREYLREVQESIEPLLSTKGLSNEQLAELLLHEHITHNRQNIHSFEGYDPKESARQIGLMRDSLGNEKFEALRQASRAYRAVREKTIIPVLEDSGMFSKDMMEIIKGREFYARMDVVKYIYNEIDAGSGHLSNILKQQLGSFEDVANPFTATILQDIKLIRAVNMNKAAKKMVDFLSTARSGDKLTTIRRADYANVGGKWVPKHPSPKSNLGIINYIKGGKIKGFYVDKHVAISYNANPTETGIVADLLNMTNSVWRELFIVRNPGFWLFNGVRDYKRAAKNIEGAGMVSFLPHYMRGLKKSWRNQFGVPDDVVRAMYQKKMLISIESRRGMSEEDAAYERLLVGAGLQGSNDGLIRQAWDAFGNLGQVLEQAPKIAGVSYYGENHPGMSTEEVGHRIRTEVGSPDFLRKGTGKKWYNNIFLFANAIKEGWRGDWQVASDRPGEYIWKTAKYSLLPKMMMVAAAAGALNHLMPDAEEIMRKVPEFDKTNYFIIPLYLDKNNDAVYLRIPMDETGRFLGGLFWKAANSQLKGGENIGWFDHVVSLTDYMAGQAPGLSPTLGIPKDVINYTSGNNVYDNFRGRMAIPEEDYAAGPTDPRVLEQFGRYQWNKLGGGVIRRMSHGGVETPTTDLSDAYKTPFLGPVLQRLVKTSHAGEGERLRNVGKKGVRDDARHRLDLKEAIITDINDLSGPPDPMLYRERAITLYKQLKNEGVVDPVFDTPSAFVAKYLRYATRSEANVYYDVLASSKSRKEQILMLREIEDDFGPEKFKEFIKEGVTRKVITKNLLESKLYMDRKGMK